MNKGMEISLIRHGMSKHAENKRITYKDFKGWVEKYDDSGVFEQNTYPLETLRKIASAQIVVTSDLKRAIESAEVLDSTVPLMSKSVFREIKLPHLSKDVKNVKLPPNAWAVILRCSGAIHMDASLSAKKKEEQKKQLIY